MTLLRSNTGEAPLKPSAVCAEINVRDIGAVAAARSYSFQARLQLVNVDRVVMRGHGEKLAVGTDGEVLHFVLAGAPIDIITTCANCMHLKRISSTSSLRNAFFAAHRILATSHRLNCPAA